MTSREYIYDLMEAITNQIQIASHLQELITNDRSDFNIDKDNKEILSRISINAMLLEQSISIRRDMMKKLEQEFSSDHKYWCLFKHALASRWFSLEVTYANNDYVTISQRVSEQMFMIVSQFLWTKLTNCWRCLLDSISNNNVLNLSGKTETNATDIATTDPTTTETYWTGEGWKS